jgi:membrane protease YdiL (CAAX protease family)
MGCTAALAEEIFFRGLVFNLVSAYSDPITGALVSSAIFGLAHHPVLGASAVLEATLGGLVHT